MHNYEIMLLQIYTLLLLMQVMVHVFKCFVNNSRGLLIKSILEKAGIYVFIQKKLQIQKENH